MKCIELIKGHTQDMKQRMEAMLENTSERDRR